MTAYEAVVYDLDETLVQLAVDWRAVAHDVRDIYTAAGIDIDDRDLWAMLEEADKNGIRDKVEATIAEHERAGAKASRRLARATEARERTVPTGVCSLNCEAACRIALEEHELSDSIDAVVGRDTVTTSKPDPEPLLEVTDRLSVAPSKTLFIGDSKRDEQTAQRAGTAFEYVDADPSDH